MYALRSLKRGSLVLPAAYKLLFEQLNIALLVLEGGS